VSEISLLWMMSSEKYRKLDTFNSFWLYLIAAVWHFVEMFWAALLSLWVLNCDYNASVMDRTHWYKTMMVQSGDSIRQISFGWLQFKAMKHDAIRFDSVRIRTEIINIRYFSSDQVFVRSDTTVSIGDVLIYHVKWFLFGSLSVQIPQLTESHCLVSSHIGAINPLTFCRQF
jgi:hypothetical protein